MQLPSAFNQDDFGLLTECRGFTSSLLVIGGLQAKVIVDLAFVRLARLGIILFFLVVLVHGHPFCHVLAWCSLLPLLRCGSVVVLVHHRDANKKKNTAKARLVADRQIFSKHTRLRARYWVWRGW